MNKLEALIEKLEIGALLRSETVSGGSINEALQLETTRGKYFLKLNSSIRFPNMFGTEKRGLELLGQSSFEVPKPLRVGTHEDTQFIVMNWVEQGSPRSDFWNDFGNRLAKLHLISSERFGLNRNNYIGSLIQNNSEQETWAKFYTEQRLIPQLNLAEKQGRLTQKMKSGFDALFLEIGNIFPIEKPSLLHGDLWSGNMMVSENGSPCIFDPAVYFGHREMDLAMMALFGGFGENWVDAYNATYPLAPNWKDRIEVGQLYPLMVHVNLFGGSYGNDVERILERFT